MVINSSLSILIDGSIISEAMVIIDNDHEKTIHCYPCNANVDTTIALHELAISLVRRNIAKPMNCYVALIMARKGIVTIPVSDSRTLNIYINTPLLYRKVTNELITVLNTLINSVSSEGVK